MHNGVIMVHLGAKDKVQQDQINDFFVRLRTDALLKLLFLFMFIKALDAHCKKIWKIRKIHPQCYHPQTTLETFPSSINSICRSLV